MKTRNLIILAVVAIGLAAFIYFYERHQPTTEQARERSDKVFPGLERDDVSNIELRSSHGELVLAKSGEEWRLTSPIEFPADPATVSSLLGSLVNLDEERRLEPGEVDPAAYGLDAPALAVALVTGDGERFSLEIGGETALGSNRAVRRGGEDAILLCRGYFASDLDKPLDDWRSKDVVKVTADQVASIQVVAGGDRIHAVRDGDDWRLLEPISDLADRDHLSNVISNLASLRVEEFLAPSHDPAELGLAQPAYRVTLVRTEGADPVELELGATRDHDGANQVACRRNLTDLFWVNDTATTRLAKAPVLWRSAKVYAFDSWDANRLEITSGGQTVALDRAEGMWQLAEGGEVDYGGVQDRLSTLANLQAREFDLVTPITESMGKVSLELKSSAEAEGESEPVTVTYDFYRPLAEGGDALVSVSARATVMSVSASEAAAILDNPQALHKQPEPDDVTPVDE